MKTMRLSMAAALLAACCCTSFAAGQAETPPPDRNQAAGQGPRGGHGPDDGPQHGPGGGFEGRGPEHGIGGMRGHMPSFRHLQLSEAQQDKLFAIHHAAEPQLRQQQKAIRHAHEALRALGDAPQYDEAKANAAARELGQAVTAEALLRARLHAQVLAVFTPEQREQLHQRRPQPPQERP